MYQTINQIMKTMMNVNVLLSIHSCTKYLYLDNKRMVQHMTTQNLQDS